MASRLHEAGWSCRLVRAERPGGELGWDVPPDAARDRWDAPTPWPRPRLVLVTVPDRALAGVASALAHEPLAGTVVLHTSGLEPAEILAPCRLAGAAVASWHPLQSFPPFGKRAVPWEGVACAVEGDPEAVTLGEELARQLGMHPWRIAPGDKPLYHAAAAVAGNLTHVLVVAARQALEQCGLAPGAAAAALAPLLETSTAAALAARRLEALTGPIARGDVATVERHLEVLPTPLAEIYRAVLKAVVQELGSP